MSDYRPYETYDYKLNDLLLGVNEPRENQLLDDDGNPATHLTGKSEQGLASIAAALEKFGPYMTPEHLEKAVWWIKGWKAARVGWSRSVNADIDFHKAMEQNKATPEFIHDTIVARRLTYRSHFFALLTGAAAVGAIVTFSEHGGWGWVVAITTAAMLFAGLTAQYRDLAGDVWKRQDRRYFLQCLRQARCTQDLNEAGLFAYHPDTIHTMSAEGQLAWHRAARAMQLQLADALYYDWDYYLRETYNERERAYSWNWPKAEAK